MAMTSRRWDSTSCRAASRSCSCRKRRASSCSPSSVSIGNRLAAWMYASRLPTADGTGKVNAWLMYGFLLGANFSTLRVRVLTREAVPPNRRKESNGDENQAENCQNEGRPEYDAIHLAARRCFLGRAVRGRGKRRGPWVRVKRVRFGSHCLSPSRSEQGTVNAGSGDEPLSIKVGGGAQFRRHRVAQAGRRRHLDAAAVAEDVHDQFPAVGVRHLQDVGAVGLVTGLLPRVPLLRGDPARSLGGEAQRGPGDAAAGEDAVAGAEHLVQRLLRHVARRLLQHLRAADGIDGKAAQVVAQVAPGVEIPVVAVMYQALRRDLALDGFVARAHEIGRAHV